MYIFIATQLLLCGWWVGAQPEIGELNNIQIHKINSSKINVNIIIALLNIIMMQ